MNLVGKTLFSPGTSSNLEVLYQFISRTDLQQLLSSGPAPLLSAYFFKLPPLHTWLQIKNR